WPRHFSPLRESEIHGMLWQPVQALAAHGEKVGLLPVRPRGQRQLMYSARPTVRHAAPAPVLSSQEPVQPLSGPPRQAFVQQIRPVRPLAVVEPPPSLLSASPAPSRDRPSAPSAVAQPDACPLLGT